MDRNRVRAFKKASSLVQEMIDYHGLETYRQSAMFGETVYTPVDQEIEATIRVADWLLDKE